MDPKPCNAVCIVRFKSPPRWEEVEFHQMIGVIIGIMSGVADKPIKHRTQSITSYSLSHWVLRMTMTKEQAETAKRLIEESYSDVAEIKFQTFEIA